MNHSFAAAAMLIVCGVQASAQSDSTATTSAGTRSSVVETNPPSAAK